MKNFKFEELKDEILEFAIEKSEGTTVFSNRIVSIDELREKYEHLYDSDVFIRATNEIIAHIPHIVKPNNSKEGRLSANSFTKTFLDTGGFTKLLLDKIVNQKRESKKEEFDFRISRFLAKTQWLPHLISILSIIIAIISLCISIFCRP